MGGRGAKGDRIEEQTLGGSENASASKSIGESDVCVCACVCVWGIEERGAQIVKLLEPL